jgi:site-specific DNA-methyltransferase (adenine-specific)
MANQNLTKAKTANLYNEDAFITMKRLAEKSVDFICTDLPYGITQNKWDSILPLDQMWKEFNRIIKDSGAIVLTATFPFAAQLVCSNPKYFRYDIVWEKTVSSGQLNVKRCPLRAHELILVFYKKPPTYNEQKTEGEPYKITRKITKNANYGLQSENTKVNDGFRHAKSVIKISNPRIKGGHPTQKPVELMEHLIKTYTNKNDVVFDCCMGSGTTGVAAKKLKRHFIGAELNNEYFTVATKRLSEVD